jgi:concanavalin A-like lectin/glucanase superfamily protein
MNPRRLVRRARLAACAVTLVAALATPAVASAGIADSVRGWWPMWEGAGQTVYDWSGHGNHGQLGSTAGADVNDPAWVRTWLGSYLRFGGDDFVRIRDTADLEPQNVTVSAWVRASQSPGTFRYIVGKGGGGCYTASYALMTGDGGGLMFYAFNGNDWVRTGAVTPAQIWNGRWHHVAGTYDGTRARFFVDGVSIGDSVLPTGSIDYTIPSVSESAFGGFLGSCDLFYTGDVAQVAIFGEALPVDEIYAKIASLFPRPLR